MAGPARSVALAVCLARNTQAAPRVWRSLLAPGPQQQRRRLLDASRPVFAGPAKGAHGLI